MDDLALPARHPPLDQGERRRREDAAPRLLDADGARAMGDGLSEMRRLIDPDARQWQLVFIPGSAHEIPRNPDHSVLRHRRICG